MNRRRRSNNRINSKKIVIAGLLLAIGIILPSIFHTTGIPGTIFLPMHIGVLLGGFLLPPSLAFLLGALTPILNNLVTGMPVLFPMVLIMTFELGVYGFIASVMYRKLHASIPLSLIVSMIIGRLTAGVIVFLLVILFTVQMDPIIFVKTAVLTGMPGIIIQLILVPTLIYALNKYTTINLD